MSHTVVAEARPAHPRRAGLGRRLLPRGLLPLAAALGAWQLLGNRDSVAFARPSTWGSGIARLYTADALMNALSTTLYTFAVSLLVATALGLLFGMALGAWERVERAFTPLMDFFRTLPPPAVVPVAALLLGPTVRASVAIIAFVIIWPILLNTARAMREIPHVRLDMARSIGLTRVERLSKVVLPSLVPGLMVGVRIALSISLVVTLLVDIIGHGSGVGQLMLVRQQRFDTEAVWGLLLIIGTLGYVLNAALAFVERRLPWCRSALQDI